MKLWIAAFVLIAIGLAADVGLVLAAREYASDDMRVGRGGVNFPPQGPRPGAPHERR